MSDEDVIRTSVGWAAIGDNLYGGYSVSDDLFGSTTLWSALSVGLGHGRLTEDESRFLDDLAVAITAGDPRVWPLKITWLVGCHGSAHAAMAAAHHFLGTAGMGPVTSQAIGQLWVDLDAQARRQGQRAETLRAFFRERKASGRLPPGFGHVPGRNRDERIALIDLAVDQHARTDGRFYRLAKEAETALHVEGLQVTLLAALSACLLDLGFAVAHLAPVAAFAMTHSLWASAHEAASLCPATLQRVPSSHIEYVGQAERRAQRKR